MNAPQHPGPTPVATRIANLDWPQLSQNLLENGCALTGKLLSDNECCALTDRFDADEGYRSHIHMARYGFGKGEYKYFDYPLPSFVETLRACLYPPLAQAANIWAERLRDPRRFPAAHDDYIASCHNLGQNRPTPLILRYRQGDFNHLHKDLYGDEYFPFQLAILLSEPGDEFDGGEFMLVENRPRMQSKATVIPLLKGEAIIFAVNQHPRLGLRGYHKTSLRHGVSEIRRGERHTLGIIFHDAR